MASLKKFLRSREYQFYYDNGMPFRYLDAKESIELQKFAEREEKNLGVSKRDIIKAVKKNAKKNFKLSGRNPADEQLKEYLKQISDAGVSIDAEDREPVAKAND